MYYDAWPEYVPVAERRRLAAIEMRKREKKSKSKSQPVLIQGLKIVTTPWGKAWCENLESYSDYESRLPRGRTYARNGSVVDLRLEPGLIKACVMGSSLYDVSITVGSIAAPAWKKMCAECAGGIDSMVELMQGRLDKAVMQRLCKQHDGLFPSPKQLKFICSCPDGAYMCKHVAAVLYGVGNRLDTKPELLFHLRGVDASDLIAEASIALATAPLTGADSDRVLVDDDVGALFGLDMGGDEPASSAEHDQPAARPAARAARKKAVKKAARPVVTIKAAAHSSANTSTKTLAKGSAKSSVKASVKASAKSPIRAKKVAKTKVKTASLSAALVTDRAAAHPAVKQSHRLTVAQARKQDQYAKLRGYLAKMGTFSSSDVSFALGISFAHLRPLLIRLVSEGHAVTTGQTSGMRYHIV